MVYWNDDTLRLMFLTLGNFELSVFEIISKQPVQWTPSLHVQAFFYPTINYVSVSELWPNPDPNPSVWPMPNFRCLKDII